MSRENRVSIPITGLGSVSSFGPCRGLIAERDSRPRVVHEIPARGIRKAFLVQPFRPADVVPGLKTRRLDRLSVWCLIAAHLALRDAQIDLEKEDHSRFGVVFGTGYGCSELTEAYLKKVADVGYGAADPIVFPETLDNSPASHVARVLGLRGPNITLSCRGISGEAALIQGASLLHCGEADRILVLAGDTLNRPLYEWYEAARVLSASCYAEREGPVPLTSGGDGFVPGEGLAAAVMETGGAYAGRGAHAYARFRLGRMGADPEVAPFAWGECSELTAALVREVLGAARPAKATRVVASANGSPRLDEQEARAIQMVFGPLGVGNIAAPKTLIGEFDGNAILRLILALSGLGIRLNPQGDPGLASAVSVDDSNLQASEENLLVLLGASTGGSRAALSFSLP
jgi:3-oxoacyl-[acyl-carrier-protein] synthase II